MESRCMRILERISFSNTLDSAGKSVIGRFPLEELGDLFGFGNMATWPNVQHLGK